MKPNPKDTTLTENLASENMETLLLLLTELSRPGVFGHFTMTFKDGRLVNMVTTQMSFQIHNSGQWPKSATQEVLRKLLRKSGLELPEEDPKGTTA